MGSPAQKLREFAGQIYDARTRRPATRNQIRYARLVEQGRCVACAEKLPEGRTQRKCAPCLEQWYRKRTDLDKYELDVVVPEQRARIEVKQGERCKKCWLLLPHDGCLPTIEQYASSRRGSGMEGA
jgi:hypothetical protein